MKKELRTLLVGTLAIAIGGIGMSTTARALAANTAPEWVTLEMTPSPAAEGQQVTLHGVFTDPDVDDTHTLDITWGNGAAGTFVTLTAGAGEFWLTNTYKDDALTGTPSDTFTVTVTVSDGFDAATSTTQMTVNNVAPTVGLSLSSSVILDHESVSASGTFTDPGIKDTFVATLDWGDGSAPWTKSYLAATTKTFDAGSHAYPVPGTYTVTASVRDDDTGVGTNVQTLMVQSRNRTPSDLVLSATTPVEGDAAAVSGTFSDLDAADTHTVAVDFGDGAVASTNLAAAVTSFGLAHVYTVAGAYTATVTVTDPANAAVSGTVAVTVLVRNFAPADLALSVSSSVEGSAAVLSGSFTDANTADSHTVVIDWGDGSAATHLALAAGTTTFNANHTFAGTGWYSVNVTVADDAQASVSASADADVLAANHAPTALALSVTSSVEGAAATLSGTFNDPDANDTHTVVVNWGDGSAVSQISLDAAVGSVTATHAYASAGSYTVSGTVSDDSGLSTGASTTAVVTPKPVAPATLDTLRAMINSWPLDAGTKNSLLTKVKDSCSSLSALANEVSAQSGKKLSATQVSTFNELVGKVAATYGCTGATTPTVKRATATAKGSVTRH